MRQKQKKRSEYFLNALKTCSILRHAVVNIETIYAHGLWNMVY